MAQIALGPINNNQSNVSSTPKPQIETPKAQKIENELMAEGAKKVGEQAFEDALKKLEKLLDSSDVNIISSLDEKGMQQIKLMDKNTGKAIAEIPPESVVEMAEKAREHHIGWLINRLV